MKEKNKKITMYKRNQKKALTSIIAIPLVILVSIASFFFIQNWYSNYSNSLFSDVEMKVNKDSVVIESLTSDKVYIRNYNSVNLSINTLKIGGVDCQVDGEIGPKGVYSLNISSCLNETERVPKEIVLNTKNGVFSKVKLITNVSGGSSGSENEESGLEIATECYSAPVNTLGSWSGCDGMLIVNRAMLDDAIIDNPINGGEDFYIEYGGINYTFSNSTHTIFTGQITDMSGLFSWQSNFYSNINHWDVSSVTNMNYMFNGADSFNQPLNNWDVSNVIDMSGMFSSATNFNQDIGNWDVSSVITMSGMFSWTANFNQPLNNWDVSQVTNMNGMFSTATNFNENISTWDVSSVIDMGHMFNCWGSCSFNQPLNNWDVSSVTNMDGMFYQATNFNQPLNNWDVGSVTNMDSMFYEATSFNQNLTSWCPDNIFSEPMDFATNSPLDSNGMKPNFGISCPITKSFIFDSSNFYLDGITVKCPLAQIGSLGNLSGTIYYAVNNSNVKQYSLKTMNLTNGTNTFYFNYSNLCTSKVTNMSNLFASKSSFNGNISYWDVSNVIDMSGMFYQATNFNQPLNNWNVSVTSMYGMFYYATNFNQSLNNWNVSNVTDMSWMFYYATSFNQPLNSWDVSSVTSMFNMFSNANNFNQPLNNWDVSSVTSMFGMFADATSFNQPLNSWDVSNVADMAVMFIRANNFNQNLTCWNVSLLTFEPSFFAYNSGLTNPNKPVWGTSGCH